MASEKVVLVINAALIAGKANAILKLLFQNEAAPWRFCTETQG